MLEIHVKPDDPKVAAVEKAVLFALGWIAAFVMAFGFFRCVCVVDNHVIRGYQAGWVGCRTTNP